MGCAKASSDLSNNAECEDGLLERVPIFASPVPPTGSYRDLSLSPALDNPDSAIVSTVGTTTSGCCLLTEPNVGHAKPIASKCNHFLSRVRGQRERGHTKMRATIGRPRGNGRPVSPHSQRCHRSVRSMFTWGALYVRCSSWRLIVAVFTAFL